MNGRENQVSVNIFEQINSICKEFRRAWKTGARPRIEEWLGRVNEQDQLNLFSNLLQQEFISRQNAGEQPNSSEYLRRFPKFGPQIRSVFDESTMSSMDESHHSMPGDSSVEAPVTRTFEIPAANRLGDYELVRELGRGGFGVVYEAKHLKRGNRVALKTLPTGVDGQEINADRLHKFRREFRSLSEINHPHLVGMQTLEVDGSQWFFTMDLIDGEDFLSYVRPNEQLDEERLRLALKQLAAGMIFLHERRIVHRDLKPSNVLVDKSGRVVILDFGLVAKLQSPNDMTVSRSGMFAGTPRYAAPEQMFGERSEASDWYAFGTMLYESLTGQPPFVGIQMELLHQKQNQNPPKLTERKGADFSTDLAALTDGLLEREPKQRMAADEVVGLLQMKLDTQVPGSTQGSTDSSEAVDEDDLLDCQQVEVVLVGREAQLAGLTSTKEDFLASRKSRVVWICGKSGEGKSALADTFLSTFRKDRKFLVISGRCYDRESVPFKALDCVIDPLASYLRSTPEKELDVLLPEDLSPLAHLFPTLRRVKAIDQQSKGIVHGIDEGQVRKRAFYTLRELLQNISRHRCLVVLIDDLQWGDRDSAKILKELLSDSEGLVMLFMGGYRSDEVGQSDFLQHWFESRLDQDIKETRVEVGPLSPGKCIEMMSGLLNVPIDRICDQRDFLFEKTSGNPYLIEQLSDQYDAETDRFREFALAEIIRVKLSKLPESARPLLEAIAVAGKAMVPEVLGQVAEAPSSPFETLTHMRSEHLVRFIGTTEQALVDTYHDRIRESVVDRLSSESKRNWHLRHAEILESLERVQAGRLLSDLNASTCSADISIPTPARVYDLAYHFLEAEDRRAFVYQFLAGEESAGAFAMDNAREHLEHAIRMLPEESTDGLKYRLFELMGNVCKRLRDPDHSFEYLKRCQQIASSRVEKARATLGIGSMHRQLGNMGLAMVSFDRALDEIGRPRPKSEIGNIASFVWSFFKLLLVPEPWRVSKSENHRTLAELEFRILLEQYPLGFDRVPLTHFARISSSIATAAGRSGRSDCISFGDSIMAGLLGAFGFGAPFARIFAKRALNRSKSRSDYELEAVLGSYDAALSYTIGDTKRGRVEFEKSLVNLRRYASDWDINFSLHNYRRLKNWVGSSTEEIEIATQELEAVAISQNPQQIGWAEYGLAYGHARAGNLDQALRHIRLAEDALHGGVFRLTLPICLLIKSFIYLQCSDYTSANSAARLSWSLQEDFKTQTAFSIQGLCFLQQSLAGPNWLEPTEISSPDKKRLRQLCKKAKFWSRVFPVQRPWIGRALGRSLWALNQRKAAVRWFRYAVEHGRKYFFGYELSRGLLDLSVVDEENRKELRSSGIELLRRVESVIPRAESWLLGDQYDEMVVAPEFDLKVWEREHRSESPNFNGMEKIQ